MAGVVVAIVGLVGSALSAAGQYTGSSLYLALGMGGMKPIAGYPSNLSLLLIGVLALLAVRRCDGSPLAARRPAVPTDSV